MQDGAQASVCSHLLKPKLYTWTVTPSGGIWAWKKKWCFLPIPLIVLLIYLFLPFLLKILYVALLTESEVYTQHIIPALKGLQPSAKLLCGAFSSKMQHSYTYTNPHSVSPFHSKSPTLHLLFLFHSFILHLSFSCAHRSYVLYFVHLFTLYPQCTLTVCLGHLCQPTWANRKGRGIEVSKAE